MSSDFEAALAKIFTRLCDPSEEALAFFRRAAQHPLICIVGGSVLATQLAGYVSDDIDIFILVDAHSPSAPRRALDELFASVSDDLLPVKVDIRIHQTILHRNSVFEFDVAGVMVKVTLSLYHSAAQLLAEFDIDICQCALHAGSLLVTPCAQRAIVSRTVFLVSNSEVAESRLRKYEVIGIRVPKTVHTVADDVTYCTVPYRQFRRCAVYSKFLHKSDTLNESIVYSVGNSREVVFQRVGGFRRMLIREMRLRSVKACCMRYITGEWRPLSCDNHESHFLDIEELSVPRRFLDGWLRTRFFADVAVPNADMRAFVTLFRRLPRELQDIVLQHVVTNLLDACKRSPVATAFYMKL